MGGGREETERASRRERERKKRIKRERAPLGYNHSLSSKMTYKLAYSYAFPVKGKKKRHNFHMLIQIMARQSNYQKNCEPCLSERSQQEPSTFVSVSYTVCLSSSNQICCCKNKGLYMTHSKDIGNEK